MDDVPHFVYQWPVPPAIPPYVPAISEPVAIAWAHAGVAAAGGERPEVMAGTDRAASEALQVLDAEFPGSGSCVSAVLTPETIKKKSVGYPRWVDDVKSREPMIARCLRSFQACLSL